MESFKNNWTKDFICGSISGIFGILVGHPLDTIKVNSHNFYILSFYYYL